MRVKDVAKKHEVTQHTVIGWIHSGQLVAVDVSRTPGGKPRWRITEDALAAFEQARASHATPPAPKRRKRRDDSGVIAFYS